MRCSSLCVVVQCTTRPVYSSREAAVKRSRPPRTLTLLGDEFQQSLSEYEQDAIFYIYLLYFSAVLEHGADLQTAARQGDCECINGASSQFPRASCNLTRCLLQN